jgi:hypothetical protein
MDKTALVREVTELFRMNGHSVETSVKINHREIDVVARELQGLVPKGTPAKYRDVAEEFVEFLIQKDVLLKVTKSEQGGGWVVKLNSNYRSEITDFSREGKIGATLAPFFEKKGLTQ